MNSPSNTCCNGDERVDSPIGSSKCMYEWVVFSGFFIACILWVSIMAVGEFNELYGV